MSEHAAAIEKAKDSLLGTPGKTLNAGLDVGWRQVAACSVLLAASGGIISTSYGVIAVPLSHVFHPTRMVLMLAMTIMSLVSGLGAPVVGSLMDRLSLRRLMALGAGCVVAGFLALSFVTSFHQVLVIYGLFMAPATLLIGPLAATVLLSRWFVTRRGTALGIAISGVALGRAILTDPAFWLAAVLFAVVLSGMYGMVVNLVPLATDQGINPGKAALLVSIYSGCCFIAKLTFAAVADRVSLRTLMFISLAGFGLGMACMIRAQAGYGVISLGVALIGLFGGVMVPMQSLAAPRIFGRHTVGRAAGLLTLVSLCALLATPPVFGRIFDLTGNYADVFIVFTAVIAVTMLVIPYIRLHPRATPG